MFYSFKCKVHGRVVNYMQGYKQKLYCPVCDEAEFKLETSQLASKEQEIKK